jgi:hypothetical protein
MRVLSANSFLASIIGSAVLTCLPGVTRGEMVGFLRDASGNYTALNYPGATLITPFGINAAGDIVGLWSDPISSSFLKSGAGNYSGLDYPSANYTVAYGINNAGDVVGYYNVLGQGTLTHAFFSDAGGNYATIDYPGATEGTIARGINNAGEIVGFYPYGPNDSYAHGFLRDAGGNYVTLNYPGAQSTIPYGINDSGTIVGAWVAPGGLAQGFERDAGGNYSTLDYPGASLTEVFGINNAGDTIGLYVDSTGTHNFLRDAAGNYSEVSYPGAISTTILGINDSGEIVGYADITPQGGVPEPSSLLLFLSSLPFLSLGWLCRRRGKADTHRSSRSDGKMETAKWPALLGRPFVRAGVCARPTHTGAWAKDYFAGCLTIQQALLFCPLLSIRTQRSCGAPARTRIYPCLPTRAATSSMKTVLAFTTASLAAFERLEASPGAGRVTATLWFAPYCDPPKQANSAENARFRSRALVGLALNRHPDAARWLRE